MASFPSQKILLIFFIIAASLSIIQINSLREDAELEIGEVKRGLGLLKEQREFDYFMLALQWPGTICRGKHRCCSSSACCKHSNSLTEFTIHGLWPDYNDGTWPTCCNGHNFDAKEISPLHDAMEKYWPSLSCGKPSTCHGGKGTFWAHEWEKHGTCSSSVVRDEYGYFLTALNVYFKYNVTQVLNDAGYVPSNSEKYPLGGIITAIQNAFHTTPELQCKGGAVEELRLCFYKDFTVGFFLLTYDCSVPSKNLYPLYELKISCSLDRDCASEARIENYGVSSRSSCPRYVSLPAQVSSGFAGEQSAFHQSI